MTCTVVSCKLTLIALLVVCEQDFRGRQLRIEYAKRRRPDDPRDFYSSRDG